jgi:predicted DNA-binding protein
LTSDIDRYTLIPDSMSPKTFAGFRLEPEMLEGLRAIKERTGIPIAEQVRRAVLRWLEEQGAVEKKAERKRAATRKRS